MTPDVLISTVISAAGFVATSLVAVLAWSMRRNVRDVDEKVISIATDVRQLASQGARHGEALAGGVVKFATIEKRLDKVEAKQEKLGEDCAACRVERARE